MQLFHGFSVAGNCLCEQGELERAKELFLEAIGVEADCIEAIFNLGLVNKQLGILSESLQAFEKLHTIVPSAPEVIYHIANLCVCACSFEAGIFVVRSVVHVVMKRR